MNNCISMAALLVVSSSAAAQVSYVSDNMPQIKGDPDRVVCKKEETIGTRLGGRNLCLTVSQWIEKAREHRAFAEDIQSGAWPRDSAVELRSTPDNRALTGLGPQ